MAYFQSKDYKVSDSSLGTQSDQVVFQEQEISSLDDCELIHRDMHEGSGVGYISDSGQIPHPLFSLPAPFSSSFLSALSLFFFLFLPLSLLPSLFVSLPLFYVVEYLFEY